MPDEHTDLLPTHGRRQHDESCLALEGRRAQLWQVPRIRAHDNGSDTSRRGGPHDPARLVGRGDQTHPQQHVARPQHRRIGDVVDHDLTHPDRLQARSRQHAQYGGAEHLHQPREVRPLAVTRQLDHRISIACGSEAYVHLA